MMSASQQNKLRKLLQYHPTTAGGMMNPDYVSVVARRLGRRGARGECASTTRRRTSC